MCFIGLQRFTNANFILFKEFFIVGVGNASQETIVLKDMS